MLCCPDQPSLQIPSASGPAQDTSHLGNVGMPSRVTTILVSQDFPRSVLKVWGPRQLLSLRQIGAGDLLLPSEKFYQ